MRETEVSSLIPLIAVEIDPTRLVDPNPPDPAVDPFFGLAHQYQGLVRVLPQIGIRSLAELATVEGEDLMHRVRSAPALRNTTIPNPVFGAPFLKPKPCLATCPR